MLTRTNYGWWLFSTGRRDGNRYRQELFSAGKKKLRAFLKKESNVLNGATGECHTAVMESREEGKPI